MVNGFTRIALLTGCAMLASCASLKPPERPAYSGPDTTTTVEATELVGVWTVKELNPYPDSPPQSTTIEYKADGTVTGLVEPQGEQADVLGNMQFEMNGKWVLAGDLVTHSDMNVEAVGDSNVAKIITNLFKDNADNLSGQANIYEFTADRMVTVGTDGAAMEYIRQ